MLGHLLSLGLYMTVESQDLACALCSALCAYLHILSLGNDSVNFSLDKTSSPTLTRAICPSLVFLESVLFGDNTSNEETLFSALFWSQC